MRKVVNGEPLPRAVIPGRPLAGSKGLDHALLFDVGLSFVGRCAEAKGREGAEKTGIVEQHCIGAVIKLHLNFISGVRITGIINCSA